MKKPVSEINVGDRWQQKRTGRICRIVKAGEHRVQYLYEDAEEKGLYKMQYRSAFNILFVYKFVKVEKLDNDSKDVKPT